MLTGFHFLTTVQLQIGIRDSEKTTTAFRFEMTCVQVAWPLSIRGFQALYATLN